MPRPVKACQNGRKWQFDGMMVVVAAKTQSDRGKPLLTTAIKNTSKGRRGKSRKTNSPPPQEGQEGADGWRRDGRRNLLNLADDAGGSVSVGGGLGYDRWEGVKACPPIAAGEHRNRSLNFSKKTLVTASREHGLVNTEHTMGCVRGKRRREDKAKLFFRG